jgi:hypothetical protein
VKSGHETGSNHPYLQHRSVPFIVKAIEADNPRSKQTPNATEGASVTLLFTAISTQTQLKTCGRGRTDVLKGKGH